METYTVEILNPKALRLLTDLADLNLIAFLPKTLDVEAMMAKSNTNSGYRTPIVKTKLLSEQQKTAAREAVMQGSPDMDLDAMLAHLRDSRTDRPLPFRD